MSYQGINFANQRLVPSDDGRLYQNIFNDGALYGCQLTYTGTELTISQGHLVIGGRQMKIESAEVVNVNGAVSGFAQIVIAIDLTKTATISTFNQISIEVRYSAAEDGFSTLTQTDINGSGSYYEAQLALLSLGTGGITGIVQDMPQAAFKGAAESGGLTLHVVGDTAAPANPAENTVWVDTDTEISGYSFSATEPENPVEGMVWLKTGTISTAAMNIDKKNTVMLYPTKCQQYVGGAWTSKIAKTYLNGTWVAWWKVLYASGELGYELATGFIPLTSTTTVQETSDYIKYFNVTSSGNVGGISSEDPVDVTGYSTLKIKCRVTFNTSATDKYKCGLATTKSLTDWIASASIPYSTNDETELNIPVPADGGEYYLVFTCGAVSNDTAGTQHVRISGIRLEA